VPGSIVWMMPGEKCTVSNNGKTTASYLLINMNSRNATKLQRGKDAGGSFIIDFKEQEFKSHDKGGIRNYFRDRSSAMFGFTEMHVTTLNPQIKSHEPHTHRAAEMVIMLSGDTEMQIGDQFYKAQTGDFYFLDSNVSHAIRNTGNEACMYLAFQWE
jgi:(S)-ureidoglycine aminohydrolase